MADPCERD